MSNVLPLTRWKDKRLAEREEVSDVEDSEDEESDVEDFTIPKKARKRKIGSSDRNVKKPRLQIPKKSSRKRRAQEPPSPSSGRPRKPKASQITSKISYSIIGSEQAYNIVQICTHKNASTLM